MTPQQRKIQVQLDLRAQELDEKEALLRKLDKKYDKVRADIKVAESMLEIKNNQVAKVDFNLQNLYDELSKVDQDNAKKAYSIQKSANELKELENSITKAQNNLNNIKSDVEVLKNTRDTLKSTIKELKEYVTNQENMISEAIQAGNDALLDIKSEIAKLNNDKEFAFKEMQSMQHEKEQVEYSLVLMKQHYEQESKEMEEKRNEMRQKFLDDEQVYLKAKKEHENIEAGIIEQNRKLTELKISITAERKALMSEKRNFEIEKRRWNSEKSLFDEL